MAIYLEQELADSWAHALGAEAIGLYARIAAYEMSQNDDIPPEMLHAGGDGERLLGILRGAGLVAGQNPPATLSVRGALSALGVRLAPAHLIPYPERLFQDDLSLKALGIRIVLGAYPGGTTLARLSRHTRVDEAELREELARLARAGWCVAGGKLWFPLNGS